MSETSHELYCTLFLSPLQIFRVYECGTEGPVLLFLHGGGFSALSWSLLSVSFVVVVVFFWGGVGGGVWTDMMEMLSKMPWIQMKNIMHCVDHVVNTPFFLLKNKFGFAVVCPWNCVWHQWACIFLKNRQHPSTDVYSRISQQSSYVLLFGRFVLLK